MLLFGMFIGLVWELLVFGFSVWINILIIEWVMLFLFFIVVFLFVYFVWDGVFLIMGWLLV